jgi:hypothetical protein
MEGREFVLRVQHLCIFDALLCRDSFISKQANGLTRTKLIKTESVVFICCLGSRYISWLPSFSVEVTHMLGGYATVRRQRPQTSQFDNMVRHNRHSLFIFCRSIWRYAWLFSIVKLFA